MKMLYCLSKCDGPKQYVTKEEFVKAERMAGFNNTMGQPTEPATQGFFGWIDGHSIRGMTEFAPE